jgi:hypothetical protein
VAAALASAGTLVYNADDTIYAANDDGSGQRALITPDDVHGAVSVYYPWVQPNGSTVVFSARTPYAGYNGLYCGFHCVGVYRWDAGTITRLSPAPIGCGNDLCSGLDTDPRITADGSRYFYEQVYAEPNSSGSFNSISTPFVAPAVAGGGGSNSELKGACNGNDNYSPSPVDADDYLYVDCVGNGNYDYAIKRGDSGEFVAADDVAVDGLAWRADGGALADSESGGDPGIWTIDLASQTPKHLVQLTWDYDHSQYSASPTFVGNDKVAFFYGNQIRVAPTSCDTCSVDQTSAIIDAADGKGLAWTSKPVVATERPSGGGQSGGGQTGGGDGKTGGGQTGGGQTNGGGGQTGGGQTNGGGGQTGGGTTAALAPKKAKIKTALKGLKVPFTATGTGSLKLTARLDAKTAKKLGLGKKAITVATGSASATKAGSSAVVLKFNKKYAKKLGKAKSLKLALSGSFIPTGGAAQKVTATVSLAR